MTSKNKKRASENKEINSYKDHNEFSEKSLKLGVELIRLAYALLSIPDYLKRAPKLEKGLENLHKEFDRHKRLLRRKKEKADKLNINLPLNLINLIPNLPVEKQADVYLKLMEYLYPKRKAIELTNEIEQSKKPQVVIHLPSNGRENPNYIQPSDYSSQSIHPK